MKKIFTTLMILTSLSAAAQGGGTDGLEVHFPMEVTGNAVKETVSGRAFEVSGVRVAVATQGAVGKAVRLDGYSSFLAADVDLSGLNAQTMTFAVWCAAETYPMMNLDRDENSFSDIAGTLDPDAKTGFAFSLSNRGNWKFACYAGGGNSLELAAPNLLPKRQWNLLVATLDTENRELKLFLNGEKVAEQRLRAAVDLGSAPLLIGKSKKDVKEGDFLLNTFNGIIDEVSIYNKVLGENEVKALAGKADVEAGSRANMATPTEAFAADLMRPRFHGMPSAGWMNECHGMTFSDGKYHIFFQKNGNGPYMSRLHWGHIATNNLYDWEEQPIAIDPAESYDIKGCWSGCVVEDRIFGENPAIIYTGVDYAKASINFATPLGADLIDWEKAGKNPQIAGRPAGLSDDFRDPYFFRTENGAYIIVGSSNDGVGCCTLHKYNEANGTWTNDGKLFFKGTSATTCGRFWEMPNVTKMDGDRWLFTVTPLETANGVQTLYWVGTIDANGEFQPSAGQWPQLLEINGMSKKGYGLLSPSIYQKDSKTLAMGIVPDKVATAYNYQWGWAHCFSLPREWNLDSDGLLMQKPLGVLTNMRVAESAFSLKETTLSGTEKMGEVGGRQIEVCATFEVGSFDFGFDILSDGNGKQCRITYIPNGGRIKVDFSTLDRIKNDNNVFDGVYVGRIPNRPQPGETMKIQAYFDGSVLDLFVADRYAASIRIFATSPKANGVYLYADGNTLVREAAAWNLDPKQGADSAIENVWADDFGTNSFPKARFEINPENHQLELYSFDRNSKKVRVM